MVKASSGTRKRRSHSSSNGNGPKGAATASATNSSAAAAPVRAKSGLGGFVADSAFVEAESSLIGIPVVTENPVEGDTLQVRIRGRRSAG